MAVSDAVVAALVGVATVGWTLMAAERSAPNEPLGWLGWICLVFASAVLIVRRRFPVTVAVATVVISALYYPLDNPDGPIALTCVVAFYTVASLGKLKQAAALGAIAVLGVLVVEHTGPSRHLDDLVIFLLAGWVVAAVALGGMKWAHGAYQAEMEERAAAVEHSRSEEIRRLAAEENVRIARELHDAVGHHISLVRVQATAALHTATRTGATSPGPIDALHAIKDASGQALRELRAVLRVLRQVDDGQPRPQPGIHQLSQLVHDARAIGLEVNTSVVGVPHALPREVEHAAFRIVQEALTNVTRHAHASHIHIRICYEEDDLTVEIRDDGRGGTPTPGNGLLGMAERAHTLGGELTAWPDGEGGFRVHARLPAGLAS